MKLISKTINKIVLEITPKELANEGFIENWDRIRKIYPASDYQKENIHTDKKTGIVIIILEKKTILTEMD